jgi:cysteinyl-tRNA synthetase
MQVFNSLTRKKESLKTLKPGEVTMYACGPTVYNYAHIGNFRTYVFGDLLRRTLSFLGYRVNQVMNLTDVDDKTIRGANAEGVSLDEYTARYKEAFFQDCEKLGIQKVEHHPAATDYIEQMIAMIQTLVDKGVAYKGKDGSVYYAIKQFPKYGCLSHLKLDELQEGASDRVSSDEYDKDSAADFVLWKGYDEERDGKIFWDSPFGPGRPGWHMECSTMAIKLLGETIDIHIGGVDLIFPHHENEIAQSEACTGCQFANYWLHAEHLIVNNKKMSKSLGNFFTVREIFEKGYTGRQLRYMLLQTHYKTQLNFTFQELDGVKSSLARFDAFIQRMQEVVTTGKSNETVIQSLDKALLKFTEALSDDLNISVALAALFDCIREINALCDQSKVSATDAEAVIAFLKRCDTVLGVFEFQKTETFPRDLEEMALQRQEARVQKQWALADQLRDAIAERGYTVEDTAKGPRLKKL